MIFPLNLLRKCCWLMHKLAWFLTNLYTFRLHSVLQVQSTLMTGKVSKVGNEWLIIMELWLLDSSNSVTPAAPVKCLTQNVGVAADIYFVATGEQHLGVVLQYSPSCIRTCVKQPRLIGYVRINVKKLFKCLKCDVHRPDGIHTLF